MSNWIAPESVRVPDFAIAGPMKCGTSTVHQILGAHPRVFVADGEVNFFDMDDMMQHGDYCFYDGRQWYAPEMDENPSAYWSWYQAHFEAAPGGALWGEDSTMYLTSEVALRRLAMQRVPPKIIVCLRHPTARTYSQYWHWVRTGRGIFSFEDTLRYEPQTLLDRSMYCRHLRNLWRYFEKERVFFFVFEDFVRDPSSVVRKMTDFLEIDYADLPAEALKTHANQTMYPRFLDLQLWRNRRIREFGNSHYRYRMPFDVPVRPRRLEQVIDHVHEFVNPMRSVFRRSIAPATKDFLDGLFLRELDGIDELVGEDVLRKWFG